MLLFLLASRLLFWLGLFLWRLFLCAVVGSPYVLLHPVFGVERASAHGAWYRGKTKARGPGAKSAPPWGAWFLRGLMRDQTDAADRQRKTAEARQADENPLAKELAEKKKAKADDAVSMVEAWDKLPAADRAAIIDDYNKRHPKLGGARMARAAWLQEQQKGGS